MPGDDEDDIAHGEADATRSGAESVTTRTLFSAERAKAFVDAVVAIAMTLLILPLMDSIAENAETHTAAAWFSEYWSQLLNFALSFWVIAIFWVRHHQLFAAVERVTIPLLWITVLWMMTIVWLPVATAMSGQMDSEPVVKAVYIGSMVATSVCMLFTRLYLRARPRLHSMNRHAVREGASADVAMILLFATACVIAVLVPAIGYLALFLLVLVGPLAGLLQRIPFWGRFG